MSRSGEERDNPHNVNFTADAKQVWQTLQVRTLRQKLICRLSYYQQHLIIKACKLILDQIIYIIDFLEFKVGDVTVMWVIVFFPRRQYTTNNYRIKLVKQEKMHFFKLNTNNQISGIKCQHFKGRIL